MLFAYSKWQNFSRTKHRPLLSGTNERNCIAIRFHGANSMLHIFRYVHKTQNSPVVFDFVFCDCEIIKALRGRRIQAHSCSNSHASKGFGFSASSSKTRCNDLWSREPICQSSVCGQINMYSRYTCFYTVQCLCWKYAILKHMIAVDSELIRTCG
jgi:hypothetical protein